METVANGGGIGGGGGGGNPLKRRCPSSSSNSALTRRRRDPQSNKLRALLAAAKRDDRDNNFRLASAIDASRINHNIRGKYFFVREDMNFDDDLEELDSLEQLEHPRLRLPENVTREEVRREFIELHGAAIRPSRQISAPSTPPTPPTPPAPPLPAPVVAVAPPSPALAPPAPALETPQHFNDELNPFFPMPLQNFDFDFAHYFESFPSRYVEPGQTEMSINPAALQMEQSHLHPTLYLPHGPSHLHSDSQHSDSLWFSPGPHQNHDDEETHPNENGDCSENGDYSELFGEAKGKMNNGVGEGVKQK